MTVEIILMKMNVVAPVLLRKAGVVGRTPWLTILIGFWGLALIKAYDLPKTTHLEMKMVGNQVATVAIIIFPRLLSLCSLTTTRETTTGCCKLVCLFPKSAVTKVIFWFPKKIVLKAANLKSSCWQVSSFRESKLSLPHLLLGSSNLGCSWLVGGGALCASPLSFICRCLLLVLNSSFFLGHSHTGVEFFYPYDLILTSLSERDPITK